MSEPGSRIDTRPGWTFAMHPVTMTSFPEAFSSFMRLIILFSVVSTTVHVLRMTMSASSADGAGVYPSASMLSDSSSPSPKFIVQPYDST